MIKAALHSCRLFSLFIVVFVVVVGVLLPQSGVLALAWSAGFPALLNICIIGVPCNSIEVFVGIVASGGTVGAVVAGVVGCEHTIWGYKMEY